MPAGWRGQLLYWESPRGRAIIENNAALLEGKRMYKYCWIAVLLSIVFAGLIISGCASPVVTPSTPSTPSSPPLTPPSPPVAAPVTPPATQPAAAETAAASTLADAGKILYVDNCARCHGVDGQGSARTVAVVGSKASLGKYNTAQGLFDFISKQMPLGAGGSLSQQAYSRLVVYLLVQNGYVTPSAQIDSNRFSAILLTAK
jgi:mono/diheme cytochrome c family protein